MFAVFLSSSAYGISFVFDRFNILNSFQNITFKLFHFFTFYAFFYFSAVYGILNGGADPCKMKKAAVPVILCH